MIVRRLIDAAQEDNNNGLLMVFLDWAKAFDRITPTSLVHALRRFGLPEKIVHMIGSIYRVRRFFVQDFVGTSSVYERSTGIAQGCPLSPVLFVIVQLVLFNNIYEKYHAWLELS